VTARCDMTDLLVQECSHCTGRDGGETAERRRKARLLADPSVIKAQYPGACSNCGEGFLAGEPIRSDWHGGWDAWCCL